MRRLALLSLFSLGLGCEDPPPPLPDAALPDAGTDAGIDAGGSGTAPCDRDGGPRDARSARGLTNICAQGLILSGFGIRVHDGALPMARWGILVRPGLADTCRPGSSLRGATLGVELDTRVGLATVRVTHHVVGGGDPPPPPDAGMGFVGVAMARGSAVIDLDAVRGDTERVIQLFDLRSGGLEAAPEIAVVLDGIEIETEVSQGAAFPLEYNPAQGYALRSVGARIGPIERMGTDLRFEVTGTLGLGRVGEAIMDQAAGVARTRMIVHYLVVGSAFAPVTGSVTYRETHFGHAGEELAVCRPAAATTSLVIDGPPGTMAAPGLTFFSLQLFPDLDDAGAYVHELSILVDAFEHDPVTGRATMQVEGFVSNQGPPAPRFAMDYIVDAEVALLSWTGTGAVVPLRYETEIGGGRSDLELPFRR